MHIFDLHTAYLAVSNVLLPYDPDEKRIKTAQSVCRMHAAPTVSTDGKISTKKQMAEDIGKGLWRKVRATCGLQLL